MVYRYSCATRIYWHLGRPHADQLRVDSDLRVDKILTLAAADDETVRSAAHTASDHMPTLRLSCIPLDFSSFNYIEHYDLIRCRVNDCVSRIGWREHYTSES